VNYPLWDVPTLGGTWIIGIISILHVFVSHFAVGGGAFFALTEWLAYKNNDEKMYDFLKKHSLFFLLVTTVFGAVTGVGIWWSISLASPNGTATLIQNFSLAWAIEYLFFLTEIATFAVYHYTWNHMPRKQHVTVAIWYAIISYLTLFTINGILTFMLTPGKWATSHYWFDGWLNEGYGPAIVIRVGMTFAMAGMYAFLTTSQLKDPEFRAKMMRYASKWFIPAAITAPIGLAWYFLSLPPDVLQNATHGFQTAAAGNFSVLTRAIYMAVVAAATVMGFVLVGPYLNARGFTTVASFLFLVCGLLVTSTTEWSREMLRKPYVVYNYMYSNGVLKSEVPKLIEKGYVASFKWATQNPAELGQNMFRNQCASCHTVDGYRSMKQLLGERDEKAILALLQTMQNLDPKQNPYTTIMPPVIGKKSELEALSKYLYSIKHPETAQSANTTMAPPQV
jgi:cytochrome d ubiquinol oxidase subunit I